ASGRERGVKGCPGALDALALVAYRLEDPVEALPRGLEPREGRQRVARRLRGGQGGLRRGDGGRERGVLGTRDGAGGGEVLAGLGDLRRESLARRREIRSGRVDRLEELPGLPDRLLGGPHAHGRGRRVARGDRGVRLVTGLLRERQELGDLIGVAG